MSSTQWIVVGIGCGALIFGIIAVFLGIRSKRKLGAMSETRTIGAGEAAQIADAAGESPVEVKGRVESEQPLVSPASGTQCVYYRHMVEQLRYDHVHDSSGHARTQEHWDTVTDEKRHAPFLVRDETGAVVINPEKAEFVAEKVVDRRYESGHREPESGAEAAGQILGTVVDSVLRGTGGSGGIRTTEWVIPLGRDIYVLGNAGRSESGAEIRKGEGPFIISHKSEEELTKKYRLSYTLWLVFGSVFGAGGLGAIIYGAGFMKK